MSKIIAKYRKEAQQGYLGNYSMKPTWREAILESIFRPKSIIPGKEPMSHLHPNIDKLHLPEHIYIADWRKYQVADVPALVNFQKRCHAAGLHDPWLRNYVFFFYPNIKYTKTRMAFITQGLTFGFIAASALFAGEKVYDHFYPTVYEHTQEYIVKYGPGGKPHH